MFKCAYLLLSLFSLAFLLFLLISDLCSLSAGLLISCVCSSIFALMS